MDRIKSTKGQAKQLLTYGNGCGFLIYKVADNQTCEVEFFIKDGVPCYLTNGKPVELNFEATV